MATEAAATTSPQKRRIGLQNLRFGRARQEVENPGPSDIQHAMYQMLLGVDERITKPPQKYNVGEMVLGAKRTFDTHEYDGFNIQPLDSVESLEWRVPYVAHGTITFDAEQNAIIHTAVGDVDLGSIDPHMQRLVETAMQGQKLAVPIVFDEVDGATQVLTGDKVAYLVPNPDRRTRSRLGKIAGSGIVKGKVKDVDPDDKRKMKVEVVPGGKWLPPKNITVHTDSAPTYDKGTDSRPTGGEPVQQGDRVLIPVVFAGKAMLDGSPSLISFSHEHMLSYERQRQTIETHLRNLDIAVNDTDKQSITRPNGDIWDISEPHAREVAARYMFAELRQLENLLTVEQQKKVSDLVELMAPEAKPMIFADNDPMRSALDNYFRLVDRDYPFPRLAESMTPQRLLGEMMHMTAFADYPPRLEDMMTVITQYPEQFGQIHPLDFIHSALVAREEQLRTGANPDAAINSLLDILPYLKEQEVQYSSEWFAHLIHAGMGLTQLKADEWGKSTDLEYFMRQCLSGLTQTVYADEARLQINHDALFTLFMYIKFMREWPQKLPFGLGHDEGLKYVLRDLEIVSSSRGDEGTYAPEPQEYQTVDETELDNDQFDQLVTGLQRI